MKIYVGNQMYKMTEIKLKNLFSPFGEVLSSHIITDQNTRQIKIPGSPENMAYVEMAVRAEGK